MAKTEKLSASLEDYLEAIWHLVREKQVARSKDIADRVGVNKSSVTGALKNLAGRGLIHYEAYQFATLTEAGMKAAAGVVRRHEVIRDFLRRILGLSAEAAEENACRVEHALDTEGLERLVRFVEFILTCPRTGSGWIEGFQESCTDGPDPENCRKCLSTAVDGLRTDASSTEQNRECRDLCVLEPGEEGRIVAISPPGSVSRKLRDKGVAVGALVVVEEPVAGDDAVVARVRGYHLKIPREQARAVKVERVN